MGVEATSAHRVLIAEDDPIFRRVLEARLLAWGYHVIAVANGTDAWAVLQGKAAPELLILDRIMPGIDGLELCRRVRSSQLERYHYILLISGKDEKRHIIEGLDAGADDYLIKPFDDGELHARIRAGRRILFLQHDLVQALEALRYQATHDDLTGLWSRGTTLHLLRTELERGARSGSSTGVLLADLDHFKKINDRYGHLSGDIVLKEATSRITLAVRSYDIVGRYGGEEFLIVLSDCTRSEIEIVAERIRKSLAQTPISAHGVGIKTSISIGAAVSRRGSQGADLIAIADAALYEAKKRGRNCVVVESVKADEKPLETPQALAAGNGAS